MRWLWAALCVGLVQCPGDTLRTLGARSATVGSSRVEPVWGRTQLTAAAQELRGVLAREGVEGLRRLRLRDDELEAVFLPEAVARIRRTAVGLTPSAGERRWSLFASLAGTELVGFCARGARAYEEGGVDGFRQPAFVVERLLIVGKEPGGYWGAWLEGLVWTSRGWRFLPTTPMEQQVEAPRRDHADVQLWSCDLDVRPTP